MLPGALSPILGILFVVLGVLAVWLMFDASRSAPQSPRTTRMIQAHRIAGYLFVALFCLMTWFMILKVKGRTDDLPPPSLLHVLIATLLAPLLFVKVLVASGMVMMKMVGRLSVEHFTWALHLHEHSDDEWSRQRVLAVGSHAGKADEFQENPAIAAGGELRWIGKRRYKKTLHSSFGAPAEATGEHRRGVSRQAGASHRLRNRKPCPPAHSPRRSVSFEKYRVC